jgi:hypothetical protein
LKLPESTTSIVLSGRFLHSGCFIGPACSKGR